MQDPEERCQKDFVSKIPRYRLSRATMKLDFAAEQLLFFFFIAVFALPPRFYYEQNGPFQLPL